MINFEEQMRKQVSSINKWGLEAAEKKPLADYLAKMRETILSEEMLKLDPKLSLGEKEARARTSEAYKTHLKGLQEAEHQALVAVAKRETAKAAWESLRSLCGMHKMHMKTFESEVEHEV